MDTPYEGIPTQGQHREDQAEYESGMNVRAPRPPDPVDHERGKDARDDGPATYHLLRSATSKAYRLRARRGEDPGAPAADQAEDYTELAVYGTGDPFDRVLEHLPDGARFIVLENTQTGDVSFIRDADLTGDWTEDGRFDQFTVFEAEQDAAAYADARQQGR